MDKYEEFLGSINSKGNLEEAFLVLLNFNNISAVCFDKGSLKKSETKVLDGYISASAWEVLPKLKYTDEEIQDFFDKVEIYMPVGRIAGSINLIDSTIHIIPRKKAIFIWKK